MSWKYLVGWQISFIIHIKEDGFFFKLCYNGIKLETYCGEQLTFCIAHKHFAVCKKTNKLVKLIDTEKKREKFVSKGVFYLFLPYLVCSIIVHLLFALVDLKGLAHLKVIF